MKVVFVPFLTSFFFDLIPVRLGLELGLEIGVRVRVKVKIRAGG